MYETALLFSNRVISPVFLCSQVYVKRAIAILTVLVTFVGVDAQTDRVPALLKQLKQESTDTTKVNLYYSISRQYWYRNADSVILIAKRGLALADSIGFKKGKALNCLSMGVALGIKGNYPEALKYHLQSLSLSEELKLDGLSANTYGNIANIYVTYKDTVRAIEYHNKALHIFEKYGDAAMCPTLINLSDLYTQEGKYAVAMDYARRALRISRNLSDSSNTAVSLFNIGEIHRKNNHLDSAQWYLNRSEAISTRIGDFEGVSFCLNSLAEIMARLERYQEGIALAKRSLINLKRVQNQQLIMDAYHSLYECHFALQEFNQALVYRNQEIMLKENIFNLEKKREANNLVNLYNLEHKELEIKLLEKDKALQQREIAKQSLTMTIYGIGSVLLALIAAYYIISNNRWKNYNRIMKERNAIIQEQKATIIKEKIHSERLNSVKDKIISIISHDFRSPLNTLQGFLQLLKRNVLGKDEIAKVTEQIDKSVSSTLEMIENLLTWGNTQMTGLNLNRIAFDLEELVRENLRLAQPQSEAKQITLVNHVAKGILVFADRDTTNIVLRNLIANAIKFSRPEDSITISAHSDSIVTVSVSDTGIGIPPERQKNLFDSLMNFTTKGTSNEKGSGLGLVLCKELVEQNEGKIWVESRVEAGSTFYFTLPRPKNIALDPIMIKNG